MGTERLQSVKVEFIVPSGNNPRTINEKSSSFADLVASVKAQGVLVPLHVRNHPNGSGKFELLAGERRLRAAGKAGRALVPVINYGELADDAAFEITFAENFAREDLTPLEQGRATVTLLKRFSNDAEAVASKLGKSVKWVLQRKSLGTNLSKNWKKAIDADEDFVNYSAAHLQLIARLPTDVQDRFLDELRTSDDVSVRELDELITADLSLIAKAPWLKAGDESCAKCRKRTSCQPGLFDDTTNADIIKKNDRCLDRQCWIIKMFKWLKSAFAAKLLEHPHLVPIATDDMNYHERTQAESLFPKILRNYDYQQSKKDAPAARPGFIVFGKSLGTVLWIRPAAGAEKKVSKAAGKPSPLAERRQALAGKRAARLLNDLVEIVNTKSAADLVTEDSKGINRPAIGLVIALAHEFGVADTAAGHSYDDGTWQTPCWKNVATFMKDDKDVQGIVLLEKLWLKVRMNLVRNLVYKGPITRTPKARIESAKKLASLFALNVPAMEKSIREQIPEPKAWAKLNADGTPKLTKSKPKKKKAKAKKPRKSKKRPSGMIKKKSAV